MIIPSHPMVLPALASLLSAILKVIILPSVSCVCFIDSSTRRVSSNSPQISHVLMTVLNTLSGGFSAFPSLLTLTQSSKRAVAFRLFSFFAQTVTTFLQTAVDGTRPRSAKSCNNRTASFQLSSLTALSMARLWMSVHALCAAEELDATKSSPRSGATPSSHFCAAVRRRKPSAKLSILSAAITPQASKDRPASADAMESSSYPAAFARVSNCITDSFPCDAAEDGASAEGRLTATSATSAKVPSGGVKECSTTIARSNRSASSTAPSFARALTTAA
mmetsp:Transcript_2511/g.3803  ORF Transcript_2511/g.3803 Transcript_2511/m.3803 type:complete len:277 (+) Transcript_2511:974-1804(+)